MGVPKGDVTCERTEKESSCIILCPTCLSNRDATERLLTLILAVAPRKGLGSVKQEASPAPDLLPAQPSPGQRAPLCPQPLLSLFPSVLILLQNQGPHSWRGPPTAGHWHSELGGPPTTSSMMSRPCPHSRSVSEGPGMPSTFPSPCLSKTYPYFPGIMTVIGDFVHELCFESLGPWLDSLNRSGKGLRVVQLGPGLHLMTAHSLGLWLTAPSFTLTAVGGHPPVPASSSQQPVSWWPRSREAHLYGSLLEQTLVSCICIPGDRSLPTPLGRGPKTEERVAG